MKPFKNLIKLLKKKLKKIYKKILKKILLLNKKMIKNQEILLKNKTIENTH